MEETTFNVSPTMNLVVGINGEPIAIHLIKSGWSNPQTYHVIVEFGDMEQTDYSGVLTMEQIEDKFGFPKGSIKDYEDGLANYVRNLPNDQELGRSFRKSVSNLKYHFTR